MKTVTLEARKGMVERGLEAGKRMPQTSTSKRYLFYVDPGTLSADGLERLLCTSGARVVRRLRGGGVLALVDDDDVVRRLTRTHPEISAEVDSLLETSADW